MIKKFIVLVPGRADALCVAADSFERNSLEGAGVVFRKGTEPVAVFPVVIGMIEVGCLPDFPDFLQVKPAARRRVELEPGVCIEPLPAQSITAFHGARAPAFWQLLACGALSFICGFGMALSHAGVW